MEKKSLLNLNNEESAKDSLKNIYSNVQSYDCFNYYDMVDLYDLCVKAKLYFNDSEIHDKCDDIIDLIKKKFIYLNHASNNYKYSHRKSIYLPGFIYNVEDDLFEYYKTIPFAKNTKWDKIIGFYSDKKLKNNAKSILNRFFEILKNK